MFWNLWCEKVKFLCPGNSGSSRSETSVATSTTGSSLYLIDKKIVKSNGIRQLWYKFGPNLGIDTNFINRVVATNSQVHKIVRFRIRKNILIMIIIISFNYHVINSRVS